MTHLLLLLSLFHPSHRNQVIRETVIELQIATAHIDDYQKHPPKLTNAHENAMYVLRANLDIHVALATLNRYKHHHVSEQDVRTAVSQLERDLEDIPPAHWPQDLRATT